MLIKFEGLKTFSWTTFKYNSKITILIHVVDCQGIWEADMVITTFPTVAVFIFLYQIYFADIVVCS